MPKNAPEHKVARAVADRLNYPYRIILPLAKRAVRVLGEGASAEEYSAQVQKWLPR